jgi:hypothetical protein
MTFDVFICYSHQDKAIADAACAKLESEGIRCWIAPRDISPSVDWAASIMDAIESCRIMVLIFSGHTNRSRQVSREVQQAFDREKPVIPFRIEDVTPEKSLRYYMDSVHWLDALTHPIEQHLERLALAIRALLKAREADTDDKGDPITREAAARRIMETGPTRAEAQWGAARADARPARANARSASRPSTRRVWKAAAALVLFIISAAALSYYLWWGPLLSARAYSPIGNFACFDKAEFPDAWRQEASICAPYGCNFGKMSRETCLALGAKKQSQTVIHGNPGTTRTNECWLQHYCGDLRPHSEFTMFKM